MRNEHYELIKLLHERAADVSEWLQKENPQCFAEQRHLNLGAPERVYWHLGYLSALNDISELLTHNSEKRDKSLGGSSLKTENRDGL
jgi:hypothetical protein